jgi:hypothetical protein
MRTSIVVAAAALFLSFNACSDDDGANVLPNGPPDVGGGGSGGSAGGGAGGTGGGGTGGAAAGTGGSGVGGSGGAAGCSVTPPPDAGSDAGALDAGPGDGGVDGGDPDASGSSAPGVVSFAADLHPIFAEKCGPCHVTDFYGGHNVGGELTQAYADAVTLGPVLVQRLDGGGMPPSNAPPPNDCGAEGRDNQPGDEGCLSVEEVALVQSWIDQCYPR